MKLLSVFSLASLFLLFAGCDGDGDGTTTTETTTEETDTVAETNGPVTLDTGSATIPPGASPVVSSFSVFETGLLQGRAEWGVQPPVLGLYLIHESSTTGSRSYSESPANVMMEVTQELLNEGNLWLLRIHNPDSQVEASLAISVTLVPK